MINLHLGDCLEVMKDIPDKSVNLILTDLPYGITNCVWDRVIPFEPLWEHYNRIITDTGVVALFGVEPFSTQVRMSNIDNYKYDWYWVKSKHTLFYHAKNRPTRLVEVISVFSKSSWGHESQLGEGRMTYNPQGIRSAGFKRFRKRSSSDDYSTVKQRPNQVGKEYEAFTGFPSDVLYYDNVPYKQVFHGTQKPVDLLKFLINSYTNDGDTVLDSCMGSGSTGVACKEVGRKFIGIEIEEKYFEIAKRRIEEGILYNTTRTNLDIALF